MLILCSILNLISSYLIACLTSSFLVIFLAYFALIILNIEILSLFSAISPIGITVFSFLNLIFAYSIFKIKKAQLIKFNFDFKKLKNALMLDKSLVFLSICFAAFILISLFLAYIMPPAEPDSQAYHFLRAFEYSMQHNLNHFETNDVRALIMPNNSEIIYTWMFTLKKTFHGFALVSFFSYLAAICSIWKVFDYLKTPYRKRLFSIFIFSSFVCVITQISSLQTDIIIGAFLILAFALFISGKTYFSSLSLALAFGTKTTGIMSAAALILIIILWEKINHSKLERFFKFFGFLCLNFLIFSSYNYILNYIQFGNFISNQSAFLYNGFVGGIKGYIFNLIEFTFRFFDFTGFTLGEFLVKILFAFKQCLINILHLGNFHVYGADNLLNLTTDEQTAGFGILGFLAFLPAIFKSLKTKKIIYPLLGGSFLINLFILAGAMKYMAYSTRFLCAFCVLSAPCIALIYGKKGFYKSVLVLFCAFYLFLVPQHITRAPLYPILNNLKKNHFNLDKFADDFYTGKIVFAQSISSDVKHVLKNRYKNINKAAFFRNDTVAFDLRRSNIDFLNSAHINKYNLDNYDVIILEGDTQADDTFKDSEINLNYPIQDNKIVYKNYPELNCFFLDKDMQLAKTNKECFKRYCFTFRYLMTDKSFRLDYVQKYFHKPQNKYVNIYYFVKS